MEMTEALDRKYGLERGRHPLTERDLLVAHADSLDLHTQ
jgi:hypothetical protein